MVNPNQLLAVGKSFRGVRHAPQPYKWVAPNCLPKLTTAAPEKQADNSAEAHGPSQPALPLFAAHALSGAAPPAPRNSLRDEFGQSAPNQAAGTRIAGNAEPTQKPRVRPVSLLGRALAWVNPFASRTARGGPHPLVQSEFMLGAIKVVRNDLSDADLEVVAPGARDQAGARPAEARRAVSTAQAAKTAAISGRAEPAIL